MKKHIIRKCKKHGNVKWFHRYNEYGYRCSKCAVSAVIKRRKKVRQILINDAGGKCTNCKYNKCMSALTFHHKNPSRKKFGLSSRGLTRSLKSMRKEAKKCILLCHNCHSEVHANLIQV
jgi:ribosomal protein L30E